MMRVRIQWDKDSKYSLAFECPSCGVWQGASAQAAFTGEEFVCDCGEDIRLTAEAFGRVRLALEQPKALTESYVEIPV